MNEFCGWFALRTYDIHIQDKVSIVNAQSLKGIHLAQTLTAFLLFFFFVFFCYDEVIDRKRNLTQCGTKIKEKHSTQNNDTKITQKTK